MKKLMKLMMGIAVAAISFTGCENNFDNVQPEQKGFELTVVADNVSRTEYDADLVDIKWSAGDQAEVFVKGSYAVCDAVIDAGNPRVASFTWASANSIKYITAGTCIVQGFAPAEAFANTQHDGVSTGTGSDNRTCITRLGLKLPASQSATTATFDGAADILVADNLNVEITEDDLAAASKTVGNFKFRRMVAVSEFTYKVTNSELTASDEKVTSVSFEVVSEGKYLAGNMYVQPNADGAKYVDADLNEIADIKDVFYSNDANKVTVTLTDKPALKNGFKAWFVTSPVTLAVGDQLVFTVTTENGTTITKTVNVTNEVAFSTEMKNKLAVNLNNDVEIVAPVVPEEDIVEIIDFTAQGYANEAAVSSFNGENCDITFSKGSNSSNAPKYYTNGSALRVYGGNTFTITSEMTFKKIEFTFGQSDGSNAITSDSGAYAGTVWSGATNEVTFTIGGTTGNRRIQKLTITYGEAQPELVVPNTNITVVASATSATIDYELIKLEGTVTATTDAEWIKSIDYSTEGQVKLEFDENTAYESRTATVTLSKTGVASKEVKVTQQAKARPVINPALSTYTAKADDTSLTIEYTIANASGAVTAVKNAEATWITSIDYSTVGQVKLAFGVNTGDDREATITLSFTDAQDVNVKVTQKKEETNQGPVVVLSEEFTNITLSDDDNNTITSTTFSNFSGATDKAYKSKYGGLKLGSSKVAGYITTKPLDLSNSFTVQIDACKYSSDAGNIVVTCGNQEKKILNSSLGAAGSFKTFTLEFDAATANSTVKIATSTKRAYIDNVIITRN